MSVLRLVVLLAAGSLLAGCATTLDDGPINLAASPALAAAEAVAEPPIFGETVIGHSFSGGGTRAAAFAHGVLQALSEEPLRDGSGESLAHRVGFVSGVSGGSVAAAYFAHRGPAALRDFRQRFLIQDVEASLRTRLSPVNLARALEGGVNDRTGLPRWLDANLFGGATFGEIQRPGRPILWLNASDVYNRNVFTFDDWTFSVICSDLGSYPLSQAVAASAAVPVAFTPVMLRNYAHRCAYREPGWVERVRADPEASTVLRTYAAALVTYRNPQRQPIISLLDGGITDNLGLYGLTVARETAGQPYEPMTPQSAARLRNMLFVVVDAGRGPEGDWPTRRRGPTGLEVVQASVDTLIDVNSRHSYDAFRATLEAWRRELIAWRCGLSADEVRRLRGSAAGWNCRDLDFHLVRVAFDGVEDPALRRRLNEVETRFRLPEAEVDMVIRAGRSILRADTSYRRFLARLH
jgi:NTE family protein